MALTLQQRHNIVNGLVITTTGSGIYDLTKQSIRKIAQDILDGTILVNDAVFAAHPVTQPQMEEWALRALEGNFDTKMLPMIIDNSYIANNLPSPTDVQINTAVKASLWPYITRIGKGLL